MDPVRKCITLAEDYLKCQEIRSKNILLFCEVNKDGIDKTTRM